MQRHILDRPRQDHPATLAQAVRIARAQTPHPTALDLQRRPRSIAGIARMRAYLRIDRQGDKAED